MEDVLDLYHEPYNPHRPVVCMDETSKQLVAELRIPLPIRPGRPRRVDYEYERKGTANVFLFSEPLKGWRSVSATAQRTRIDWALAVRDVVDHYPNAEIIRLVMDNLNVHSVASLYEAFEPEEARRISRRLEIHHTPKHGSWLNVAEIELKALNVQCLGRRIANFAFLKREVAAWECARNRSTVGVDWQFTTDNARIKLKNLYPQIRG